MSSDANQPDDFDAMLSSSRELRSRYREASSEQPPLGLDDAIRAHARRAVASRPRAAGSPFFSRWRIPLSLAAMLVLSATLTIMLTSNDRHLPIAGESAGRKTAAPRPISPSTMQSAPVQQEPSSKQRELSKQLPPGDRDQPGASPPAAASEESVPHAQEKRAAPFPAAPSPAAPQAKAPATSDSASSTAESRGLNVAPPRDRAASESDAGLADGQEQKQARGKLESSAADSLQRQAKPEQELKARKELSEPQRPQSAAPAAAANPPVARTTVPAPWENDPQQWLRHIESLVHEKRLSEARESLKAFRERYPAYTLPSDFPLREP